MRAPRVLSFALFSAATACHPGARGETAHSNIVAFPGGWTAGQKSVLTLPLEWQARQTSTAEWLLRVKATGGALSNQCFTVGGASLPPRKVAAADCGQTAAVEMTGAVSVTPAGSGVVYRGREFALSGKVFGKALLSSSGRWLALLSDTPLNERSLVNPMPALGGGEPSRGDLFVDVYEAATGVRKTAGRAVFQGFGPRILFAQAFWLRDSAFVMPLNMLADQCLFLVPESQ